MAILRLCFSLFWVVVFSLTAWSSRDFPALSGIYPLTVSIAGLALAFLSLQMDIMAMRGGVQDRPAVAYVGPDGELSTRDVFRRSARYGLWLLGFVVAMWVIGFVPASALFVFLFLLIEDRSNWPTLIIGPVATVVLLIVMAHYFGMYWPDSLITLGTFRG